MKLKLIAIILMILPFTISAQYLGKSNNTSNNTSTKMTTAQAVQTIEGITAKMLELISGPVGQERNWEEFRTLFLPTAQFISLNPQAKDGEKARSLNLEEFVRMLGPLYAKEGFYEEPLNIQINEFNGMANAFQSYTARNSSRTYQAKGINNFILVHVDNRWWIASSTWANEDTNNRVPDNLGNTAQQSTNQSNTTTGSGKLGGAKKGKIILKK